MHTNALPGGLAASLFLVVGSSLAAQSPKPGETPKAVEATKPGGAPASAAQAAQAPGGIMRVKSSGATVRSLADANGTALTALAAGTPVRVQRSIAGWLDVEVPGGLPVWIWGELLSPAGEADVYEVVGDRVNLRPAPSSSVATSFPVGTVNRGTRVVALERADPKKPLAQDWVRVRAPESVTGKVRIEEVEPLAAGADAEALWREAAARAGRTPPPPAAKPAPETAAKPAVDPSAPAALSAAQALLARERAAPAPDYAPVRAAYQKVLALESSTEAVSPIEQAAREDLALVDALEAAVAVQRDAEKRRDEILQEVARRKSDIEQGVGYEDALSRLYDAHGTLVRKIEPDQPARYWIALGGREICEVDCSSGRYALDLFAGAGVGVRGRIAKNEVGATRIDAERIEVLHRP